MGEEAKGRHVRPVRVVDHQHRRPPLPEPHHQPVQRMQDPEPGIAGRRTRDTSRVAEQDRPGRRHWAVQHPDQTLRGVPQQPLEQRTRHTPTERPLQLMPARPQHQQTSSGRAHRRVTQQRGLAQPRSRLNHGDASRPTLGVTYHRGDDRQLGITLQQSQPLRRTMLRPRRHGTSLVPVPDRAKALRPSPRPGTAD